MIRLLALISASITIFAPLKEMNDIRISGSLTNRSVFNYLLLWINYALWALYSSLIRAFDVICAMYFTGLIASCVYCVFYILNVPKVGLRRVAQLYTSAFLTLLTTILYALSEIHTRSTTNHVVGVLACIASVCQAGFPLIMSPVLIETGVSVISLPMYVTNAVNSLLWFAYGYSVKDPYTANANLFGFILSTIGIVAFSTVSSSTTRKKLDGRARSSIIKKKNEDDN